MEIKNKLMVTRGESKGVNGGMKGKSQGIYIKNTWAKTSGGGGRTECGRWGRLRRGKVMGKMRTTITE